MQRRRPREYIPARAKTSGPIHRTQTNRNDEFALKKSPDHFTRTACAPFWQTELAGDGPELCETFTQTGLGVGATCAGSRPASGGRKQLVTVGVDWFHACGALTCLRAQPIERMSVSLLKLDGSPKSTRLRC